MSNNKNHSNILKKIVVNTLSTEANSTSCMILFQPKAPASLKKFSKIDK